jgi:hypothetical protein
MKPKSAHKQAATHNRHKTNNRTQKRKTQNPTPRRPPSLQNILLYFEATGARGRRLRLAGVSICSRTAAGYGVALPIVGTFSAERQRWVQKSYFCRWSRWVSKREIRLGSDIRSGKNSVNAVETVTERVKMVEKTIRRTSVSSGTTSEKPIYTPRQPRGMDEP